jgi:hypothetical protein
MSFLKLQVNVDGLGDVIREFGAPPKQADRASKRAVRKTLSWAATQAGREIAQTTQIPLRSLRKRGAKYNRLALRIRRDEPGGLLWIGYNPVKAAYVGTPKQLKRGARSGKHFFERAFKATTKSGHVGIFKRRGQGRLPIDEQAVQLQQVPQVAEGLQGRMGQRLTDLLRQELNYEVNVRGSA